MFTNNFMSMLKTLQLNETGWLSAKIWMNYVGNLAAPYSGDMLSMLRNPQSVECKSMTDAAKGFGLILGSGTAAVKSTDYAINEVTNYDVIDQALTTNMKKYSADVLNIHKTIKNTSDKDLVITEMGIFLFYTRDGGHESYMIAREVIPPVVVGPGKKKSFTMTLCAE